MHSISPCRALDGGIVILAVLCAFCCKPYNKQAEGLQLPLVRSINTYLILHATVYESVLPMEWIPSFADTRPHTSEDQVRNTYFSGTKTRSRDTHPSSEMCLELCLNKFRSNGFFVS